MKLSHQALGAVMMALQKSLLEQSDIVPVLQGFDFIPSDEEVDELVVTNPPSFKVNGEDTLNLED
jgi:hypothetical protein|tara:strand:- start:2894 stop:3088 length:195 start_codon:yes stop_codon:yes gene_type:complete